MNYKYKKRQIFGKRLKVPKYILSGVYNSTLSFSEYIEYELDDKVPISCLNVQDRMIVERFGLERAKELDWELLNKNIYYITFGLKDTLLSFDINTKDLNMALYEFCKDEIRPGDYSNRMKEIYKDRLVTEDNIDSELMYLVRSFNEARCSLDDIIINWNLFKDKDLTSCLLNDYRNKEKVTNDEVKNFMNELGDIAILIIKKTDIYSFIKKFNSLKDNNERHEYVKQITDDILNSDYKMRVTYEIESDLTSLEYQTLFRYSSLEEYLLKYGSSSAEAVIDELKTLPEDYIYNIPIPLIDLCNSKVLSFVSLYGLKNVIDFDNECDHFFTKDNCRMLKLMDDMYLHYSNNVYDDDKTIHTRNCFDDEGNYVEKPYTKDEFYEAMRRMIVYGPTNFDYMASAPDYRNLGGEFKKRNISLYIDDDAPEELKKLFYTKEITPNLLREHPEFIPYLRNKDLSSCFREREISVEEKYDGKYRSFYKLLEDKIGYDELINYIIDYCDVLDIVFKEYTKNRFEYILYIAENDTFYDVKDRINKLFKKIIIQEGVKYPNKIPQELITKYPSMFLRTDSPLELQEAFYNRSLDSKFILSNPSYMEYLKDIDLQILYRYIPVKVSNDGDGEYKYINLISLITDAFRDDSLDILLMYDKYIRDTYNTTHFKEFNINKNHNKEELLNTIDDNILQAILEGLIKYDDKMPEHFKNKNKRLFLDDKIDKSIKDKFYNREFTIEDFYNNPELIDVFGDTNIVCGFDCRLAWIIPLFADMEDNNKANLNRLKVISSYLSIQDVYLQNYFKEYVTQYGENIDLDKLKYVEEVIKRLNLSNSSEMFVFRKELIGQIMNSDNPIESLNKIEDVFIRNNIPVVGKVYSCFSILHPGFKGFDFNDSKVSPVLAKSSNRSKEIIVFSDLIKASFGSNNRSIRAYLDNIEIGYNLYNKIVNKNRL